MDVTIGNCLCGIVDDIEVVIGAQAIGYSEIYEGTIVVVDWNIIETVEMVGKSFRYSKIAN